MQLSNNQIIFDEKKVVFFEVLGGEYFEVGFEVENRPDRGAQDSPGQFYMIGFPNRTKSYDPLLNRPISLMDIAKKGRNTNTLFFLIKKVGRGTEILSNLKLGNNLFLHGPLGNSFPAPEKGSAVALVGGGVGIAPLYFAAKTWGKTASISVFYGGRNCYELPLMAKIDVLPVENFFISTEDGSKGYRGVVTELMKEEMKNLSFDSIYTCGPNIMMKTISEIAAESKIPCWVSLENRMACGMGVCLGCAVPIDIDGNKRMLRVCCDGPVFESNSVFWQS